MRGLGLILGLALAVTGCSAANNTTANNGAGSNSTAANNSAATGKITNVDAQDVQKLNLKDANIQLIDVRTPEEYKAGHIPEAKLIPLQELPSRLAEIDKNKKVYVICHSGNRSRQASDILAKNGFPNIFNIQGGMLSWKGEIVKQ